MKKPRAGSILRRCRFTAQLQKAFAQLSGDYNPLHMDATAARRTLIGGQAVHGIHQAMSALDALLAAHGENKSDFLITGFSAQFQKPVLVGETVIFDLQKYTAENGRITGKIEGGQVCQIDVTFGLRDSAKKTNLPSLPKHKEPEELTFAQLEGRSGKLVLGLNLKLARELFPALSAQLTAMEIAEILALTRLVGMHCPGLHSLFSQTTVRFAGRGCVGALKYRVKSTDTRFRRVLIEIAGPSIQGELTAFVRPPPKAQPKMKEIARTVPAQIFENSVALIIGGSRGIGEVTAKIIAAGGGRSIITYLYGAEDANRILGEIHDAGGKAESLRLDVCKGPVEIVRRLQGIAPRTVYYFATPKIGVRRNFFSQEMLGHLEDFYVRGFGNLMDAFLAMDLDEKVRVFYPSSIYVTERPREMAEYAMAKQMGEELCAFYNRHAPKIEIVVERLPRIKTDQTATLLDVPAENALDVMRPIVERMEAEEPPGSSHNFA